MTKQAYLDQLRKYLKKLPAADYADAMEYFTEYFEEADIDFKEGDFTRLK